MKFTDAQREAILAESHLLMEAGAGCGKTAEVRGTRSCRRRSVAWNAGSEVNRRCIGRSSNR